MPKQSIFNIKLGRIWKRPQRAFNEKIMTKALLQALGRLWRHGLREAGTEMVNKVPVDTGMSVASMYKFAKDFKFLMALRTALGRKRHATRPGHKNLYGRWVTNNAIYKSEDVGRLDLSEDFYTVDYGTTKKAVLKFKMTITVFQWWLHESISNWSGGKNLQLLEKFKRTFERSIEQNFSRYINQTEFKNWALRGVITPHKED
jgi:hypothetical protein